MTITKDHLSAINTAKAYKMHYKREKKEKEAVLATKNALSAELIKSEENYSCAARLFLRALEGVKFFGDSELEGESLSLLEGIVDGHNSRVDELKKLRRRRFWMFDVCFYLSIMALLLAVVGMDNTSDMCATAVIMNVLAVSFLWAGGKFGEIAASTAKIIIQKIRGTA